MNNQNILITGGNGFIGMQVADELVQQGHRVTVVDRKIKNWNAPGHIIEQDYAEFFQNNSVKHDTIVHLAADHTIEESVTAPERYYTNNVVKLKSMLDHMVSTGIKNIIFSSSGSVHGNIGETKVLTESDPYMPESPYSATKVAGEMLIKDYARAYGLNYVILRYFNPAGADPDCRFGYVQRPATHVIPLLCNKIIHKETFSIYGNDYKTRDGTCIRDYIHVADVARAHTSAIEYLNTNQSNIFNIGGFTGVSVLELVMHAEEVLNCEANVKFCNRRPGDATMLVADTSKAKQILNWHPKYSIQDIILHAWNWENKYNTVI